jgi:hypothetical protein
MVDNLPGRLHDASTDALQGLISIRKMRQEHGAAGFTDLYSLLQHVHIFSSTDARNKIFGLSSFISDFGIRSVRPNYHAHPSEIYFSLACDLIVQDRALDILGFCAVPGDFPLPSCVPDWTATRMPKPFCRKTMNTFKRSESIYSAANNTEFDGTFDKRNGIFSVSGFEFAKVRWVSTPRHYNSDRDLYIALSWEMAALEPSSNYITGCTSQEALAHTICADAVPVPDDAGLHSLLGKRPSSVHLPTHGSGLRIFASPDPTVRDSTVQMLLFFTNKGYIGLAPYTTELGDRVCLRKGAQLPIILRPKDED